VFDFFLYFPCLSVTSPEIIALPLAAKLSNGDTVDDFCFGLVATVFKMSRKHTDAGNFQAQGRAAEETEPSASMGRTQMHRRRWLALFSASINRAEQPIL
jgi:hypothetical protein